jgi:carbonic anhydrase
MIYQRAFSRSNHQQVTPAARLHTFQKENFMITEIIEYKLKESIDEEKFLAEAKNYYAYFKSTFKGFIDLEFAKGEEGWINIMHWETMEDVKACGAVLRTSPQEIANYGALTDRTSTKLTFLEQKLSLK